MHAATACASPGKSASPRVAIAASFRSFAQRSIMGNTLSASSNNLPTSYSKVRAGREQRAMG